MIPVMIVPVLNRYELFGKMLQSVDVEVGVLFIIDNGGLLKEKPEISWAREVRLVNVGHNLGIAASWNLGMKSTPGAAWWYIVNADIQFAPGDLQAVIDAMSAATEPLACFTLAFGAFALNHGVLEKVGLFDENYRPAYCEDTDYDRRCRLAGVGMMKLPFGGHHVGSVCWLGDGNANRPKNERTYPQNVSYYTRKWGGWRDEEKLETPITGGLKLWTLEWERWRDLAW